MKKTIPILVVVLIVQIIIYSLVSMDRHHVQKKEPFLTVDTSKVDYIKITNEHGVLELNKVGVAWKMVDPVEWAANESYIETLLEKVAAMKKESKITDNAEKYVLYELDEPVAMQVEIGQKNGKIEKFYCGKASDTYRHTYIRPGDSDEVWLVTGNPRTSFTRKPEQWRNKSVLALDKTMIERMKLKFPKRTIELVREVTPGVQTDSGYVVADTSWIAIPPRGDQFTPVDKALNRITNTLKRFNAIEFLDAGKDTIPDFSDPIFSIEVFLEGNQHEELDFIPKPDEDTRYIVRHNGDESTVFVVYQSSLNNLKKDVGDLKGEVKNEDND